MQMPDFESIWQAILSHAGETFYIPKGPFTYTAHGWYIISSRALSRKLTRSNFETALRIMDRVSPTAFNKTIIGSSYVKAILNDPRIRGENP